jgi:hypothetical protein
MLQSCRNPQTNYKADLSGMQSPCLSVGWPNNTSYLAYGQIYVAQVIEG